MEINHGLDRRAYVGAPHGYAHYSWEAQLDGWRRPRFLWNFNQALKTHKTPTHRRPRRSAKVQAIIDSI